ncbi:hypothetical protein MetMK1DRAFT_00005560 [Metallosphaera yellowstonensis MK1]|jgi:hypothetical protein|uniref:Uncharacterized protein n=1 Tax=Metallosphaera yellowstonensis MK1 TaxID=671065 RepID=H2C1D3_9CREN|nr:hypothetical protein [Metallosphaera yellowstonensis]EHP70054.1 hypothetical protein MetMK1DRAFT_00005560 [Metallosphaera yellowstonensis MK1]
MERLMCVICRAEESVPYHCGRPMSYSQRGNFRRVDVLRCDICGKEVDVPRHCGVPMIYFDEDYFPLYSFTEAEREEMKRVYGVK